MKRQLIQIILLTALILFLGLACERGSRIIADDFQSDMLTVALSLADENWERALMQTEKIYTDWQKSSPLVQLWVNHEDIDHVTESLIALRAAVITQDLTSALTAYGQSVENFGHLHHRDAFTLRNIL